MFSCLISCSPSLVTSYPSFLLEVGDHDNNADILLPDHPPEVFSARSERPLGCNVRPGSLITLQTTPGCSSGIAECDTRDALMLQSKKKNLTHIHKVCIDVVSTFPIPVQTVGELDSAVVIWERKRFVSFSTTGMDSEHKGRNATHRPVC